MPRSVLRATWSRKQLSSDPAFHPTCPPRNRRLGSTASYRRQILTLTYPEIGEIGYGIAAFSADFLGKYWLLFELTSVLLVAAVVAALTAIRVGRQAGGEKHG